MIKKSDERCESRVYDCNISQGFQCLNKGKYFENGKRCCGVHAPSRIKIRKEKRREKKLEEESTLAGIRWQISQRKRDILIAEERLEFYRGKLAELFPGEPEEAKE